MITMYEIIGFAINRGVFMFYPLDFFKFKMAASRWRPKHRKNV